MLELDGLPPESLTEAVIVCVPTLRTNEGFPPEPIPPSMLEFQLRLPVRSPSSVSLAEPVNETSVPSLKLDQRVAVRGPAATKQGSVAAVG